MKEKIKIARTMLFIICMVGTSAWISACGIGQLFGPTVTPIPSATPMILSQPTLSLQDTSAVPFAITDFGKVHSPVEEDPNQYLIYGNLPVSKPAADIPPELAVFLGRWEGYSYAPPVKKDYKAVMVVSEINRLGGKAYVYSGTNLQYPDLTAEVRFRVMQGAETAIEFQAPGSNGSMSVATFTYDKEEEILRDWLYYPDADFTYGPFKLTHEKKFVVYEDYSKYLESKHISVVNYDDPALKKYGKGYMAYLPEGYDHASSETWPLLIFLHGAGDRGENINLLAKASPFLCIREKGNLPFIIVAPLLQASQNSFPADYLDSVLAMAQSSYKVDARRIYVTGLSMGGEATYRFAIHQPDAFSAIAPLSAWLEDDQMALLERIKKLPVWAIHGENDQVIPLSKGRAVVDALTALGGNIRLTVLPDHDHDTWTDTYADPSFYEWFLQFMKP